MSTHLIAQPQLACTFEHDTLYFDTIRQVEAVDFNDDSTEDLVIYDSVIVAGSAISSAITFLANDGMGNFSQVAEFTTVRSARFGLADMDNDGDVDVVVNSPATTPPRLVLYINQGNLEFSPPVVYSYAAGTATSRGPALGDIDADGDIDIIVATNDSLSGLNPETMNVFVNNSDGILTKGAANITVSGPTLSVELIDVDNDFDLDLIASAFDGNNDFISVHLNDGSGNFSTATKFPALVWTSVINTGDVNNDSNIDIALAMNSFAVVLLGNGDGSFQPPTIISSAGPLYRSSMGILDVDGDSNKELIALSGNSNEFTLFLNPGDGSEFNLDLGASFGFSPNSVVIGDFNGDGSDDAAIGHSGGNLEFVYFDCGQVLLGDINADGFVNLLDVGPFVTLLGDGFFQVEADLNRDNAANLLDVAGFVELLQGG